MEEQKKCNPKVVIPKNLIGPTSKIEIRKSPLKGHGIFAKEEINKGELLEEAKLLKLSWRTKIIQDTILTNYAWVNSSCACNQCKMDGFEQYIALGYGSIYNHSKHQNTIINLNFESEIMQIYSSRIIKKDEEVFVNYGHQYWIIRDFWKKIIKNQE